MIRRTVLEQTCATDAAATVYSRMRSHPMIQPICARPQRDQPQPILHTNSIVPAAPALLSRTCTPSLLTVPWMRIQRS